MPCFGVVGLAFFILEFKEEMSAELRALLDQAAIAAEDLFAAPLGPPASRPSGPIRDPAMAQKVAQRRAEVLHHTPRNPFTARQDTYDTHPLIGRI